MTNEEQLALDAANAAQAVIDQAVCQVLVEFPNKRAYNWPTDPDRDLMAGDIVQTSTGEVTVEQRHINAVELFRANYPIRSTAGVTFRVQPA